MSQDVNPQQLTHLANVTWQWIAAFVPRLLAALAILIVRTVPPDADPSRFLSGGGAAA